MDTKPRLATGPFGIAIRVVVAIAILFAGNAMVALTIAVVTAIPGAAEVVGGSSPWGFALAFVTQLLALCTVLYAVYAWLRWVERRSLRSAGWRWRRWDGVWLLVGVAVSVVSALGARLVLPDTAGLVSEAELLGERQAAPTVLLIVWFLGQSFLQQSIPEELLFRGWLLSALRQRPILAIVVTTCAFTVIHLVSNGGQQNLAERFAYLAVPFGFSLLAVGLQLHTGSLWAAVGVHSGVHISNALMATLLPQTANAPLWLTIGGVQAALGVVAIATAFRRGKRP